mgnify:CR=1 FL=1
MREAAGWSCKHAHTNHSCMVGHAPPQLGSAGHEPFLQGGAIIVNNHRTSSFYQGSYFNFADSGCCCTIPTLIAQRQGQQLLRCTRPPLPNTKDAEFRLLNSSNMILFVLFILSLLAAAQPPQQPYGGTSSVLLPHVQCCKHGSELQSPCDGCLGSGPPTNVNIASTGSKTYHWPVPWTQWLENTTAVAEFRLEKCHGQSWLQIQRGVPFSDGAQFNTSWTRETNIVRHTVDHGNFWARVVARGAARAVVIVSTKGEYWRFSRVSVTYPPHHLPAGPPRPFVPPNGTISITPFEEDEPPMTDEEPMSLLLSFRTHPEAEGQTYRVYQADAPIGGTEGCGSAAPLHNCIASTVCGVEHAMQAVSPWTAFAPGQEHSILVPDLAQGKRKVFQIMTRDADGNKRVFWPASATPVFEQPRPVHSTETIIAVGGSIAAFLLLLLLTLVVAKLRVDLMLVERVREQHRRQEERMEQKLQQGSQSPQRRQPGGQPRAGAGAVEDPPSPTVDGVGQSKSATKVRSIGFDEGGVSEAKGTPPRAPFAASQGPMRQNSSAADPATKAQHSVHTLAARDRSRSIPPLHPFREGRHEGTDPKTAWA